MRKVAIYDRRIDKKEFAATKQLIRLAIKDEPFPCKDYNDELATIDPFILDNKPTEQDSFYRGRIVTEKVKLPSNEFVEEVKEIATKRPSEQRVHSKVYAVLPHVVRHLYTWLLPRDLASRRISQMDVNDLIPVNRDHPHEH